MDKDARIEELEREVEDLKRELADQGEPGLGTDRRDLLKAVGLGGAAIAVGGIGYGARGVVDERAHQNILCVDGETAIYVQETPPESPRPDDIWIRTEPLFPESE